MMIAILLISAAVVLALLRLLINGLARNVDEFTDAYREREL